MTVREPPSEGGKTEASPTGPSHPSLNQEASATATSTASHSTFASKSIRSKGQESADDPGAVPFIPSASKNTPLDADNKKLQHASGTRPFAPTMFASTSTEPSLPDSDLASKRRGRNPEVGGSVPGAVSVFPKENTAPTTALEDREQPSVTVAENNLAAENEIHIPFAFSVDDAPCYAEAYVTNDVENGDPATKTEPPKRWTPAMRYGIIAGALVVIALVVTLVVVFAVKSPSAAKSQFVQYQVAWSASLPPNFSPSTVISNLELTCQAGGTLKSPVITSLLDERPICPAESDSTVQCSQTPFQQADSPVVVDASIAFQCHGTSPDQLVGQATLFDTTITYSGGTFGNVYYATQLMVLQAVDAQTGTPDSDGECSDTLLILPNPSDPTNSTSLLFCGSGGSCVSDGVNACVFELEGRSEVQRAPVNSKQIQDE